MRLIDADSFKEFLQALVKAGAPYEEVIKLLDREKTAYDVDKVVERLKSELSFSGKEKERCAEENPLQFYEAKGYTRGTAVALEIVKSGGIE